MKASNKCQIAKDTSGIIYLPKSGISCNIQRCRRGEATPAPTLESRRNCCAAEHNNGR